MSAVPRNIPDITFVARAEASRMYGAAVAGSAWVGGARTCEVMLCFWKEGGNEGRKE